jgi:3-dehydroquinate dehydratase type II
MKPSERNIVLIGMPGCGKTTIGRLVAERLGREFYDSDEEIERREGKTCAEIINEQGESAFRRAEANAVVGLLHKSGIVLSVGGGAPIELGGWIRKYAVVIYVRRALELIAENLTGDTRPLSKSLVDLQRLYIERRECYENLANETVDNDGTLDIAVSRVESAARNFLNGHILVINGPNLNMLGVREPEIYGTQTYNALIAEIMLHKFNRPISITFRQSNHEGAIIDLIQEAQGRYYGIVINPGAYTHYSYAIHDALKSVDVPAVEVHISDINAREEFRKISVTAPACIAQIAGRGFQGYIDAIDILLGVIDDA